MLGNGTCYALGHIAEAGGFSTWARGRILKNSTAEIHLILNMPEKLFLNNSTIVFGLLYC